MFVPAKKTTLIRLFVFGAVLVLGTALPLVFAQSPHPQSLAGSSKPAKPADDTPPSMKESVQVMVELNDVPAAVPYAAALKEARKQADAEQANALAHPNAPGSQAILKSPKKVKISAAAANQVESHVQHLKQTQETLLPSLTGSNISAKVLYRVQRAYNGIAISVSPDNLSAISQLPGVKAVHPLHPKEPTATFSDIDFLKTRVASGGLWTTANVHGEGIKIADIDSGLDYVHSDFGGNGDYTGVTDIDANGHFPSTKVPGGTDLVGDAYNANDPAHSTPVPDSNPMDCGGHGTATASLIGGTGENNDGTTYTGNYDATSPDMSTLKISPGFAPKALLYPVRVFGCAGSTNLVTEAIEWAIDNDMDVINMSLGSNEGYPDDPDAVAAANAASMGIIVCSAAGNGGDSYFIHSSPASAAGTLSVAATFNDQSGFIADSSVTANTAGAGVIGTKYFSIYGNPCPHVTADGLAGDVVYGRPANGGNERSGIDPINPAPLDNAAFVNGKICLVDRGTSSFLQKAVHAQNSGAIALIIVNQTQPGADPIVAGLTGGPAITIPVIMISKTDGDAIKAAAQFDATTGVPANACNVTIKNDNQVIAHGGGAADTMPAYSARGPRLPDSAVKPDISAPAEVVGIATSRTGSGASNFNGTSSATPHVTGAMALLRQLHPTWSVQQLNALLCATANHDLFTTTGHTTQFGVGRVGAGRIDLLNAAASNVVAYNGDETDQIGVSFGVVETPVNGSTALTKHITIENKGATDVTYNLSIQNDPALSGAVFTLPNGNSLTVTAGTSVTIPVTFTSTGNLLKHRKESSVGLQLPGPQGRQWLTEAAAYVKFTPSDSSPTLRVAVYAAPKPVSAMHASSTDFVPTAGTGSFNVSLSGTQVNTGTNYGLGSDIVSLVKPFELQYASPLIGSSPAPTDPNKLKYVGVSSDYTSQGNKANTVLSFALEGFGDAPVPEFNSSDKEIFIDTNQDGNADFILFLSSLPNPNAGNAHTNTYVTRLEYLHTGAVTTLPFPFVTNLLDPVFNPNGSAGGKDTNSFNNSAVLVPVPASLLVDQANGLPALDGNGGFTKFQYQVATFNRNGDLVDATPVLSYDTKTPGLDANGGQVEPFMYNDLTTTSIPVNFDIKNFQKAGSLGLLLVHMHNADGARSDVVSLRKPVITGFAPASGPVGAQVTITGNFFNSGTVVTFTTNKVASSTVVNSTTIVATVPTGASKGPITVSNPVGASTSTASFTVTH